MPSPLEFAVLVLATYRLARLVTREAGPGRVFLRLRAWARIGHNDDDEPSVIPHTFFGELLTCMWCCTIWLGAAWTAAYVVLGAAAVWIALPFALSAGAVWVNKQVK